MYFNKNKITWPQFFTRVLIHMYGDFKNKTKNPTLLIHLKAMDLKRAAAGLKD